MTKNKETRRFKPSTFLLISGGPDSVYLFHHYLKKKKSFTVIHFNHHLRRAESNAEQRFVEDLCRRHGVRCFVKHIRLTGESAIQERARQERLKFCFELAESILRGPLDCARGRQGSGVRGQCVFVTAHHADDILETLVMRSARGTGLKGLTGIRRSATLMSSNGQTRITILRPLLHLTKKKILSELAKRKISFCVDSSNAGEKYFRNRVRSELNQTKTPSILKKRLLQSACLLQIIDDHFNEGLESANRIYDCFVPKAVWESWPNEMRFRFFARRMKQYGFKQQVEQRHFELALQKNILRLGSARFVQKKAGLYFG